MNPETDFAAEAIRDFNSKLSPDALKFAPQECVTIRRKPIVTLDLRLVNPLTLKSHEELSVLSTDDLEYEFYAIVTDLREDGIALDFFVNPESKLDPKFDTDRREVYLQAFEQLRTLFFSPRKDATKLGL